MSRIFHIARGVQCVSRLADERTCIARWRTQRDQPTVSMDHKAFGENEDDDDKILMIIVNDEHSGCVSADVCEGKGSGRQMV